uniref:ANK_REP_REGION domain-containing protein n=1 Tax=Caenorhabditis tropicalis TaxID=1561998 RepID=A0A1I7U509_9PELO
MPEEEEAPLVHAIVEFTNAECVMKLLQVLCPRAYDYVDIIATPFHSLTAIDDRCLPIVSPYNTHCIPDVQGMERIAQILMNEVRIGTRIPLNFRALEALIKRMEALFTGNEPFKTMVDRQEVHDLMKEATELMGKYNGKVTNPPAHFSNLSSYREKMDAFLIEYPQFGYVSSRWRTIECPIPPDYKRKTPPGEPEVDLILGLIWKKEPKKQ